MRPTGKVHLGNYVGALENWIEMQKEYENFHMIADWHVLTTDAEHTNSIRQNIHDMVIDWVVGGLDPQKSAIFVQSHIKEHAELFLLFSMLVSVSRLERNPTLKEQLRELNLDEAVSFGHLGYPVLQAADILIYKANFVPVGEDQLPHIELSREIARRFNTYYEEVFPIPEGKLTKFARLPGTDGVRMSKSLGNTILLCEPAETLGKKVHSMITDPQKIRKNDPGRPEICTVFAYHQKFNPSECPEIERRCRSGELGCVEDKKNLTKKLDTFLGPFRDRRAELEADPERVKDFVADGDRRARAVAQETMRHVREAMKLPLGGS
jgi:tryptophanyl-tRNA synthetase